MHVSIRQGEIERDARDEFNRPAIPVERPIAPELDGRNHGLCQIRSGRAYEPHILHSSVLADHCFHHNRFRDQSLAVQIQGREGRTDRTLLNESSIDAQRFRAFRR